MALDSGGASRMARRDNERTPWRTPTAEGVRFPRNFPPETPTPEPCVRFKVVETHDGEPCTCISSETSHMTLKVGEAVVLTHTCHDGRVDKITATIEAVEGLPRPPEHGTVGKA